MVALKAISFAILNKRQDSSEMRTWTLMSILGRHNKRTTILSMFRPYKVDLNNFGESTVICQK